MGSKIHMTEMMDEKFEAILRKTGLDTGNFDKNKKVKYKFIKAILFRQLMLMIQQPSTFTKEMSKRHRIVDSGSSLKYDIPESMRNDVAKELDKATERKSVGSEGLSKIFISKVLAKALTDDLIDLSKGKRGAYYRFGKPDFRNMKNTIDETIQNEWKCDSYRWCNLKERMERYEIDIEYLIYYGVLAIKIPYDYKRSKKEIACDTKFVKRIIYKQLDYLENLSKENKDIVEERDRLDRMLKLLKIINPKSEETSENDESNPSPDEKLAKERGMFTWDWVVFSYMLRKDPEIATILNKQGNPTGDEPIITPFLDILKSFDDNDEKPMIKLSDARNKYLNRLRELEGLPQRGKT